MTDYIPLNFTIMRNPFNWVIVTLMVLIAGMALHAISPASPSTKSPLTNPNPNTEPQQ